MKKSIIIGGKAGQGSNILMHLVAEALVEQGVYVFYSRDYQSLIRGGHNFDQMCFSDKPVFSNESKIDLLVALDENTEKLHYSKLKKGGLLMKGSEANMFFAGRIFKVLGLNFKLLDKQLKGLGKRYLENLIEAKKGYEFETNEIKIENSKGKNKFYSGSEAIALGAIKSGLDIYYAYPMTPATPVLTELAQRQEKDNFLVLELENEIAVANAGCGSAMTGAKTMVGTAGGGFDLMAETLSMTGIAGIPLVFYLAQRPGPGTGVATYSSQGDMNIALHSGHGEFNRIVLAPGDPIEAQELTNQCFYFSQKFSIPSILLSDKHLGESLYSLEEKEKIIAVKKNSSMKRYNSYEIDSEGSATEDSKIVIANVNKRLAQIKEISKEAKKFSQYKIYGKKSSKNILLFWGSTKGAILDAIEGLDICAIQILYLEPFPLEIEKLIKGKNLMLVEANSRGLLGNLIKEKTGIEIKKKILKYDGREFFCDELREEIRRKMG